MTKFLLLALGAALFAAAPAPAFADDPAGGAKAAAHAEWHADYDKGVAAAKAQNKPMLVDFTGSDWCGWCIKLDKEVFDTPLFQAKAPADFVLVKLDFPHGEAAIAKVPNAARNEEIQAKYGIQGFPTILVLSADGEILARGSYEPGGPEGWLSGIKTRTVAGKARVEAVAKARADFAAAPATDTAARMAIAGRTAPVLADVALNGGDVALLVPIVRAGVELDPENKAGVKVKALHGLLVAGEANEAERAAAPALDPKNEQGILEALLSAEWKDVQGGDTTPEAFIDHAVALAATGNLKNADVYLESFANSAGVAMSLAGKAKQDGEAAKAADLTKKARLIAETLKTKGPKGNPNLDRFVAKILSADAEGDEEGDEDHEGHEHGK